MAGFSKSQMFDELREIFLYQAEILALGAGHSVAAAFIGFASEGRASYLNTQASSVDLARFDVAHLFDLAYDFAFAPSSLNEVSEGSLGRIEEFMDLIPRSLPSDEMGANKIFMSQTGLCQSVTIACRARWNLECETEGCFFTVQELALLANMTEGAVRNALADKSKDGLKAVDRRKPVVVDHADAKRWLAGRRGFVSAFGPPPERHLSVERLVGARTIDEVVAFIRARIELLEPSQRARVHEHAKDWLRSLDLDEVMSGWICAELNLDAPLLMGKICETISRRDGFGAVYKRII